MAKEGRVFSTSLDIDQICNKDNKTTEESGILAKYL